MKKTILLLTVIVVMAINHLYAQKTAQPTISMAQVSLLVKDYDEALKFYTEALGFTKTEDAQYGKERWLTIAPPTQKGMALVLVKATTPIDLNIVGKQAGDRTLIVLETPNFDETYKKYQDNKVSFINQPTKMGWGRQVQFVDLYGNHMVLLEVRSVTK